MMGNCLKSEQHSDLQYRRDVSKELFGDVLDFSTTTGAAPAYDPVTGESKSEKEPLMSWIW